MDNVQYLSELTATSDLLPRNLHMSLPLLENPPLNFSKCNIISKLAHKSFIAARLLF